jgi:hypothetical protein
VALVGAGTRLGLDADGRWGSPLRPLAGLAPVTLTCGHRHVATGGDHGRRRVASGATFFADFEGPGRYEVVEGSGTVHLRSVWDGVRRLNFLRLLPASLVLDVHVNAERGTLSFPFPPGTGFGGLARHLGLSL